MIRTVLKWSVAPVLIGAVAYLLTVDTDASPRKRRASTSASTKSAGTREIPSTPTVERDALSLRVAALESQLARLPETAGGAGEEHDAEAKAVDANAEPPTPAAPLTDEQMRAISDQQRAEYDSMLEANFAGQNVDPSWAIAAEREVRDLLLPLLATGSSVGELSCRESMCRVEILHSRSEGHSESLEKLMDELRWSGAFSFSRQDYDGSRGSGSTLGFLARKGMALPADEG